ncbi:MAG TPA: restriction endonuclease subunit S [Chloroflexota bacterium]|nr:restriction endonuclease subunit S [Chloroflexota bacterium]HUM68876.1 restriction endonuclease subunit S [Chloroflexota bacterium]
MSFITHTLGEICDEVNGIIRTGPFGSQLHQSDYQEDGIPVVMPKDMLEGRVSTEDIARVGEEHVQRLSQHKLMPGDIVYARRGDIGRRAFITERESGWLCGTGCMRISLGETIIQPRFLHYYLDQSAVIEWINNQAIGATMPNLNTSIIRSIPITYPPLDIQSKITAVLSAYDDLIENNTRRIAILEEMAQTLYREWFVHFRFPQVPGTSEVPGTWDAQAGQLPEGWEVRPLGDVIELIYGKGLRKDDRIEGPYPVYGSSGIVDYHNEAIVKGPGIIVGRKGNVGSVFWSDTDFYPIDTTYHVRTGLSLHYVYYNLQYQNFFNTHAAVPGLSRENAYRNDFVVPSRNLMTRFQQFIEPVFAQLHVLRSKNANLRQTRDLLLPRLISGELDVSRIQVPGTSEVPGT